MTGATVLQLGDLVDETDLRGGMGFRISIRFDIDRVRDDNADGQLVAPAMKGASAPFVLLGTARRATRTGLATLDVDAEIRVLYKFPGLTIGRQRVPALMRPVG